MTTYWVSQPKNWCKHCKVWTDGKPGAIKKHELGKKHKEAVELFLKTSAQNRKNANGGDNELAKELARIEKAAMSSAKDDIAQGRQGYRDPTLRPVASGQPFGANQWNDFAKAQHTESDPNSFDYVQHYNQQYGHVPGGAPPEQPAAEQAYEGWTYDEQRGEWVEAGSSASQGNDALPPAPPAQKSEFSGYRYDAETEEWISTKEEGEDAPPPPPPPPGDDDDPDDPGPPSGAPPGLEEAWERAASRKKPGKGVKKEPNVKEEEVGGVKEEEEESEDDGPPPPPPPPMDEDTGMGGWAVATKPLYSVEETTGKKRKKKRKKDGGGYHSSSGEEDDLDDTGIDKDEFMADFGFNTLKGMKRAAAPGGAAAVEEEEEEEDPDRPAVEFKKKKKRDRGGNIRKTAATGSDF
jgi:hypothetical protein